jgi:diguanylate cyclase (GGDEF)-like protein
MSEGIALGLARFIRNMILAAALAGGAGALAAPAWLEQPLKGVPIGTHVELLEDPTGRLTLADVTTRPWIDAFRPATKDNVNLGYRDEALWLRIRLERGAAIGPWMLEVSYPMLDNLEFYAPGTSTPMLGGDHTRLSQRAHADRHYVFPIDAPDLGVNVYHLRVKQAGTMSVPLRLWDRDSYDRGKRDETFLLGAYYGLLAVMIAYNLFLFFIVRDRAYAAYVAYVASMGFLLAAINGFGGLYVWSESPGIADWAQVSAAPMVCATQALFSRLFLQTGVYSRRLDRTLLGIAVAGAVLMVVSQALPRILIFWADHLIALATIVAGYAAAIVSYRRGYKPAMFYLIAFFVVFAGAGFMVARNFGAPASMLTDYGVQIGSALEVVLLSMGLADRINSLRREKEQAQGEAMERERTALLLQESEERMRYQAQHDALTGLPNRWLLRDRLLQAALRAKRDRTAFAVLLVDLDNFKIVNDTLGHDVGDLLLVEVAQRLTGCIRERDTIARLGGDEFVFVLEDLAAPEDSALVARKIIEELAVPFPIAGELLRTSPSIGISLYPEDGQDADFLLKFADIAMYRAKAAGRNCYNFYHDPAQLHAYDQKVE